MFVLFRIGRGAVRARPGGQKPPPTHVVRFIRYAAIAVALAVGVGILVRGYSQEHQAGPAAALVRSIPGCTQAHGAPGHVEDYSSVSEGACTLPDGTSVRVVMWQLGDVTDQHAYAAGWTPGAGIPGVPEGSPVFCCVMSPAGSQPWAIALQAGVNQAPGSDWAAAVRATHGVQVTRIPAGWSQIR